MRLSLASNWEFFPKHEELKKNLVINVVSCAVPPWLDKSAAYVVPEDVQRFLQNNNSGTGENVPSPDSSWGRDIPANGTDDNAYSRAVQAFLIMVRSIWQIYSPDSGLPEFIRDYARSYPDIDTMTRVILAYLGNRGTARFFRLSTLRAEDDEIDLQVSRAIVWAIGAASKELEKLPPGVCFEMFSALDARANKTESWRRLLNRFRLGFRAFVMPSVVRYREVYPVRMMIVPVAFDRLDANNRQSQVPGFPYDVRWSDLYNMHRFGLAHAYNMLAADKTLYIEWPRGRPGRAQLIGWGPKDTRDAKASPWSGANLRPIHVHPSIKELQDGYQDRSDSETFLR